ncbi:MAG: hypothetical protein M1481_05735 [Candidatus Thermoplasmatota archaeon]|nr:hypothetical protein [Candidatus Thermoplasmatota archaeon]
MFETFAFAGLFHSLFILKMYIVANKDKTSMVTAISENGITPFLRPSPYTPLQRMVTTSNQRPSP